MKNTQHRRISAGLRGPLLVSGVVCLTVTLAACSSSSPTAGGATPPGERRETAAAPGYDFVTTASLESALKLGQTIAPPPSDGSDVAREDFQSMLAIQGARTTADCERAEQEISPSTETFFGPPLGSLGTEELARWKGFIDKVLADAEKIGAAERAYWGRPRPTAAHAELHNCVALPTSPSYPSVHSVEAHLAARVLGLLDPGHAAVFEQRAEQIALDRVIAGVHYPSDMAAGSALARMIFDELMKSADFRAELDRSAAK